MKILLDFLPLLISFVVFLFRGIYVATAVLMATTVVQMAIIYWLDRKLTILHKVTLGAILVSGTLTLLLHDDRFVRWKPTVVYVALALVLAVAQWGYRKNLLKTLLGSQLALPDAVWRRLGVMWIPYCLFMAAFNGYMAAFYSTGAWFASKVWGYVFPLLFIVGQGIYVARYLQDVSDPSKPGDPS